MFFQLVNLSLGECRSPAGAQKCFKEMDFFPINLPRPIINLLAILVNLNYCIFNARHICIARLHSCQQFFLQGFSIPHHPDSEKF